nr:(-)-germacrene D synthase-like [Ipomoea batatas]
MQHFFLFQEIDPSEEREVQQLKEEVRKAFIAAPPASLKKLELIDKIQRLGVDYHFENEIEASIRHIFDNYDDCNKGDDENNLYIVALRFRLLRQEGHHISCATTTEMEEVMAKENKLFHVAYAIGEMKKSVRAYHQEFMWFYTKHVPTFEEYLKVSLATTCYMTLATTSLVGMGDIVTKEVLDWITSEPLAIKANCSICRLMDDIIGHEFEQERGHVVSAVECYTKEYNVSEQEAYVEIENLISKAWKDLNQECLHPTPVPMKVLLRIMNLTRVIFLLYKDKDNYTFSHVKLKYFINTILVQPVTI